MKYICSGWRASGITDAAQIGKVNLTPIDSFNDLDPLVSSTQEIQELNSVIPVQEEQNGLRCRSDDECDESSDDNSEVECDERSAFDTFIVDE